MRLYLKLDGFTVPKFPFTAYFAKYYWILCHLLLDTCQCSLLGFVKEELCEYNLVHSII